MRVLDTLKKHLTQAQAELSRHRLDLLSSLMPTLIQVRSVNLMKAHHGFRGAIPRTPLMRHSRSALPLFLML